MKCCICGRFLERTRGYTDYSEFGYDCRNCNLVMFYDSDYQLKTVQFNFTPYQVVFDLRKNKTKIYHDWATVKVLDCILDFSTVESLKQKLKTILIFL